MENLPRDVEISLIRYARDKIPTGSFLRAVLENNLMEAVGRADKHNIKALHAICSYVYNHMPNVCHGSPKIVDKWLTGDDSSYPNN